MKVFWLVLTVFCLAGGFQPPVAQAQDEPSPESSVPSEPVPEENAAPQAHDIIHEIMFEDGQTARTREGLVFTVDEDGRETTVPDGDYILSDGTSLTVYEGYAVSRMPANPDGMMMDVEGGVLPQDDGATDAPAEEE